MLNIVLIYFLAFTDSYRENVFTVVTTIMARRCIVSD